MKTGLLVDLRGIQDYIFSSNRLKDNIGASYLISHFFDGLSPAEAIEGGGNFICLCKDEAEAKGLIGKLSRKAVEECPGLSFSAVYNDFDPDNFAGSMKGLIQKLGIEKNSRWQVTDISAFGINAQCSQSGQPATEQVTVYIDGKEEEYLLSEIVLAKRRAAEDAIVETNERFKTELAEKYHFPDRFDYLGIDKDHESFIAVVHIDGNEMGKQFAEQKNWENYKALSDKVNSAYQEAFAALTREIIKELEAGILTSLKKRLIEEKGKLYLPLRPIFIGGDDLSFVCEGRLGIWAASYLMEYLQKSGIDTCAGVAVAKVNYPFYQAQKLAEELCRSAKSRRLEDMSKENYLDFHLIRSSVSRSLNEIRNSEYLLGEDGYTLTMRPFNLQKIQSLMKFSQELYSSKKVPNSKIKELRAALYMPLELREKALQQMKARKDVILKSNDLRDETADVFVGRKTIYLDAIELIDLIPLEEKA